VLPSHLEITAAEIEQTRFLFLGGVGDTATGAMAGVSLPLLGLNPGAEYGPAKRWPSENFVAATRQISQRLGPCLWLLFGGVGDWRLCHEIAQAVGGRAINLAGRTSLRDLMGLLKLCRVLLTNDTGPMHLAAALGTPVVVPFGSTSWALTGPGVPGDSRHRFLTVATPCAPCFRRTCPIDFRCMTRLGPHLVADAVMAVLETRNG
jgi:heptosyltransferase-2